MKGLSLRQATNCETAKGKRCRCRCGGRLHGASRGEEREFFAGLPSSDPHRFFTQEDRKQQQIAERPLPLLDSAGV